VEGGNKGERFIQKERNKEGEKEQKKRRERDNTEKDVTKSS
jgi:hypothetical protein